MGTDQTRLTGQTATGAGHVCGWYVRGLRSSGDSAVPGLATDQRLGDGGGRDPREAAAIEDHPQQRPAASRPRVDEWLKALAC
jgi:hypothetical protein